MVSASFGNSTRSENKLFRSKNGGKVLANGALKRILGPERGTKTKLLTKVYMRRFIVRSLQQILLGDEIKEGEIGRACSMRVRC
jgi:hypothetical protein